MSLLTWGELKDFIDRELEKQGGGDNSPIEHIDVSWPDTVNIESDCIHCIDVTFADGTVVVAF